MAYFLAQRPEWEEAMDPSLLNTLPESEVKRQGSVVWHTF